MIQGEKPKNKTPQINVINATNVGMIFFAIKPINTTEAKTQKTEINTNTK